LAFQIKNFVSIVASMINRMKVTQTKLTDFNVGAIARTLVEAPASEIDQLYQQMFNGLREAIPVSVYQSFSFAPLAATAATGSIQLTIAPQTTPISIAAGTLFSTTVSANQYAATAAVIVPAGASTASIVVAATTTGAATNLVANCPFTMTPSPAGFVSAANLAPFVSGQDTETPAQQQLRFAAFIASLPRGTVPALFYGMSLAAVLDANGNVIERPVFTSVVEPYLTDPTQPVGLVNCYVHNGIGNTSPALVAQVRAALYGYYTPQAIPVPGYKAAGIKVVVAAATEVPVNVAAIITAATGYSKADTVVNGATVPGLVTLVTAAITSYLQSIPIGGSALVAKIDALVMSIQCNGTGLTWTIRDAILTVTPAGGTASPLAIDLTAYTVASLAAYIAAQPGYSVPYVDSSVLSVLSSQVLIDGKGDISQTNGEHLYGYTSVVWSYMDACAAELEAAGVQIGQMLLQMNTVTASGTWLDLQGAYYGVPRNIGEADAQYGPRIIATVIRPLGNNVAIESALRVLNGGLAVSVVDYPELVNNSYGLFDVDFAVSLAMLQVEPIANWQASISHIVNGMRDAGTHVRAINLQAPIEATLTLGALVISGQIIRIYPQAPAVRT
jgi:uncharacterized phage protein gp47/JayE